jgi:hypothetical protein
MSTETLRSIEDLEGFAIRATDGTIGHVRDFYFDDEQWIGRLSWADAVVSINLTQQAVKDAPPYDRKVPVTGPIPAAAA